VFEAAAVDAALAAAAIDGGRRGETLSLAEYGALTRAMPVEARRA